MVPTRVIVVCAMASEARPLVAHWGLAAQTGAPFRLFGDGRHHVVVSGIGSHASAAAVGYAAAALGTRPDDLWCNLGIAGHGTLPLGTPLVAARIAHHGREPAWYPALPARLPCAAAAVLSHDQAVSDYPPHACCDMEASGFMAAATRVADEHRVQVMKVVSDNAAQGLALVARDGIERLLQAALPSFLALLDASREPVAAPPEATLTTLADRWHFSQAERVQLRQAMRRLAALGAPVPALAACGDARTALALLRVALDDALDLA